MTGSIFFRPCIRVENSSICFCSLWSCTLASRACLFSISHSVRLRFCMVPSNSLGSYLTWWFFGSGVPLLFMTRFVKLSRKRFKKWPYWLAVSPFTRVDQLLTVIQSIIFNLRDLIVTLCQLQNSLCLALQQLPRNWRFSWSFAIEEKL